MSPSPHGRFYCPTTPDHLHVDATLPEVSCEGIPPQDAIPGGLWDDALFAGDRWARLVLPLPVLHPLAARHLDPAGQDGAALLALARGEAWWQGDAVVLPPGRTWDDGRQEPLWSWPPRLRWPPPSPSAPDWADQQITLGLSAEARSGWQAAALQETGHRGLRHLPADALTWSVPIPPPSLRPLQRRPGGQHLPGPDSHALAALVRQRSRLQRMLDLGAPAQVIRTEHRTLQLHFEALLAAMAPAAATAAVPVVHGWQAAGTPPTRPDAMLPDPLTLHGAAFLNDGSVLLAMGYATVHLHPVSGEILGTWASAGLRLLGCATSETDAPVVLYDRAADWGVHLYRPESARWLARAPAGVGVLPLPTLSPGARRCLSACGRFVWTRPGAVVGADGLPVALPWWSVGNQGAQAFALTGADAWVFVDGDMLHRAGCAPVSLGQGVQAAALDGAGTRLLLVRQAQAMLYSLEETPRLLSGLDLRWLRSLLGPAEADPLLRAALCRYGTLAALAEATDVVETVQVGDPLQGYRRLTLAEAARLRRLTPGTLTRLPRLLSQRSVA